MDYSEKFEYALERVQKAPRYTGGEMNTTVKPWEETPLRFGFCFPDTYEVGMSHLGLKILYGLINRESWSLCERFFMPWTDMIAIMKQENIPLLSTYTSQSVISYEFKIASTLSSTRYTSAPFLSKMSPNSTAKDRTFFVSVMLTPYILIYLFLIIQYSHYFFNQIIFIYNCG